MNARGACVLLVLSMVLIGCKFSYAFDDGDFQYWNTESASVKINDEWMFHLEEEFRWGDNAADFYYQHSDVGLSYSGPADWLDVSVNYRAVLEEKSKDWTWENRPHINATLKTTLNDYKLSNRTRVEFRIKRDSEDVPRYRNKTTLNFPFKWTKYGWQPYVADEIFVDINSTEMTRNRFYAGFNGKIAGDISGGVYWMIQSAKSTGIWKDTNAVGTKLKISF